MAKSRDLFDDSTMSFGEHLEVLRKHLLLAIVGVALGVIASLFMGDRIIDIIRSPIDDALLEYGLTKHVEEDATKGFDFFDYIRSWWSGELAEQAALEEKERLADVEADARRESESMITLKLPAWDFAAEFNRIDPDAYPEPSERLKGEMIELRAFSPAFAELGEAVKLIYRPVTLNVQEAFMTYIKVALIAGLVLSSPWVFYQLWLFVAAGLYPHERKYVYIYLPMSLFLFLGGAVFCFYAVFPYVLAFLLGFNKILGVTPQIRISEWISFAVVMPLMFGISFQLPLVMLFLERISVFEVSDYRQKRRMSIFVIAVVSMVLTPADPMSMLLMMFPLILLYEFGIILCAWRPHRQPFEAEPA